jgi:kumamolisin
MTDSNKIALTGSERAPLSGATLVGPTDPNQLVEVSVIIKQRRELKLEHLQGRTLSHDEFASAYGAEPEHIERVRTFARDNNLQTVETREETARRTIKVLGTVANLEKAFGVTLHDYEHPKARYRGRTGAIHLPAELSDVVQGVFGLDNRPQAQPHHRFRGLSGASDAATPNLS